MDITYAERHVRAIQLAKACLLHGARLSTVQFLTGLDLRVLKLYFFDKADPPKTGKRPDSIDAYLKNATKFTMVDASVFYSLYRRNLYSLASPAQALLCAYEDCRGQGLQITFDRAFYIVCWTDGMWASREKYLTATTCKFCNCNYVAPAAHPEATIQDCPFCLLWTRYAGDPRMRSRFPQRQYEGPITTMSSLVTGLRRLRGKPR